MRKNNSTSDNEFKKEFRDIIIEEKSKTVDPTSKWLSYNDQKLFIQLYGEYKRIIATRPKMDDNLEEGHKQISYVYR